MALSWGLLEGCVVRTTAVDVDIGSTLRKEGRSTEGAPVLLQAAHQPNFIDAFTDHDALGQEGLGISTEYALHIIGYPHLDNLMMTLPWAMR